MRELLERLGNPHARLKIIHIAGTKGKGSTAAMIAAILSAAGHRTGLYTSPHLDRAEERIAIDGQPCSTSEFTTLVERVRQVAETMDRTAANQASARQDFVKRGAGDSPPTGPTYFEIVTAMALLHFADRSVDAAVLEVGLGGRLDSTNVVTPVVSVITNISFDHMTQLGSTLEQIAGEKAGIIKPGVPVVSGVMDLSARRAIETVLRPAWVPVVAIGPRFRFSLRSAAQLNSTRAYGLLDFQPGGLLQSSASAAAPKQPSTESQPSSGSQPSTESQPPIRLELGLVGGHQAANAAVAAATVYELRRQGWSISDEALRRGLRNVHCPARLEVVARRPTVVIDTAHNVASIAALVQSLSESFSNARRLLIFAATQDKQAREMLELLAPLFQQVLLTRYTSNPRGMELAELAAIAASVRSSGFEVCASPATAWRRAAELITPEHLVCVTGSFFLAADIRAELAAGLRIGEPAD